MPTPDIKPSNTRFQEQIEEALTTYIQEFDNDDDWPVGIKISTIEDSEADVDFDKIKADDIPHNGRIYIGYIYDKVIPVGEVGRLKFMPLILVAVVIKTSEKQGYKKIRRYLQRIMNEFYAIGIHPGDFKAVKENDKSFQGASRLFYISEQYAYKFEKKFNATLWYD